MEKIMKFHFKKQERTWSEVQPDSVVLPALLQQ